MFKLTRPFGRTMLVAGTCLLGLAACDSASNSMDPTETAKSSLVSAAVINAGSGVIATGQFTTFVANESGRTTTEFWDNASADNVPGSQCNSGFFVVGTIGVACKSEAAGSYANRGLFPTGAMFLGTGAGFFSPNAFTFAGSRTYKVKLLGSYAGDASTVGWYTKSGGVYTFNAVAAWGARTINSELTIDPGTSQWGFFVRNIYINPTGSCGPQTACTDATGGFTGAPFQQFALFSNSAQTKFMVGIEDNIIEVLIGDQDEDHNDYMFSVEPAQIAGGQGCSPGYWKNHTPWPAPYTPGTLFNSVFNGGAAFAGKTLLQVLNQGGGGLNALGRQTVGALLNAASPNVSFELTPAQVIAKFNAAVAAGGSAIEDTKNEFEALTDVNGRVCPNPAK